MKKFQFTLGRVQEFKTQILDREKNTLAQLRVEKVQMQQQVEELDHEAVRISAEMEQKSRSGITVLQLKGYQYQLEQMRFLRQELLKRIAEQEERIEKQLQVVLQMDQEVSGLEKLREHQWEAYGQALAKASENEISEFVSARAAVQMKP